MSRSESNSGRGPPPGHVTSMPLPPHMLVNGPPSYATPSQAKTVAFRYGNPPGPSAPPPPLQATPPSTTGPYPPFPAPGEGVWHVVVTWLVMSLSLCIFAGQQKGTKRTYQQMQQVRHHVATLKTCVTLFSKAVTGVAIFSKVVTSILERSWPDCLFNSRLRPLCYYI